MESWARHCARTRNSCAGNRLWRLPAGSRTLGHLTLPHDCDRPRALVDAVLTRDRDNGRISGTIAGTVAFAQPIARRILTESVRWPSGRRRRFAKPNRSHQRLAKQAKTRDFLSTSLNRNSVLCLPMDREPSRSLHNLLHLTGSTKFSAVRQQVDRSLPPFIRHWGQLFRARSPAGAAPDSIPVCDWFPRLQVVQQCLPDGGRCNPRRPTRPGR
jgi:hypothetical protein